MSTAQTIKRVREKLGLTHEAFGKLIKVSASAISHYESGRRQPLWPRIKRIVALAKKHDITIKFEEFTD